MKTHTLNLSSSICLLAVTLLAFGATAKAAETPALKDAYKGHFNVGAAEASGVPRVAVRVPGT